MQNYNLLKCVASDLLEKVFPHTTGHFFAPLLKDFVYIKGGQFMVGEPESDPTAASYEKPQYELQLNDFYLGKYAVTLAQFAEFIAMTNYQTDADKDGSSYIWKDSKEIPTFRPYGTLETIGGPCFLPILRP